MREFNRMKFILVNNKDNKTLDEFVFDFYRRLRLKGVRYIDNSFDELLTLLYEMENERYAKWQTSLGPLPYTFVRQNISLITNIVKEDKLQKLEDAKDMMFYQRHVVSTITPIVQVTKVITSKKDLLLKIKRNLLLLEVNDDRNLVRKAQKEFESKFDKFKDDTYLNELYNNLLNGIEFKMRDIIVEQIKKVEDISVRQTNYNIDNHTVNKILDMKEKAKTRF